MLQHIPTMLLFNNSNNEDTEHELANAYFHSINFQLVIYEQWQECVPQYWNRPSIVVQML
jgi:hypothetical protein